LHPREFEYFAPKTLREASLLLKKHKDSAKVLAGGCSLIPLMKLRLASPKYIVDINRIGGLDYVKRTGNTLRIGALTRYYEIEYSDVIKRSCPILAETVRSIGDPQVRSRGTVGGNMSHGDPANDLPVAMLALDAELVIKGPSKQRTIRASKFYTDVFTTTLSTGEILTEIRLHIPGMKTGGSFQKFERRAGDFAIVSAAAQLTLDNQNRCKYAGISLGAVGPTPIKVQEAEKLLIGKEITEDMIRGAAEKCKQASNPTSDLSGSAEYKRDMVQVFAQHAIHEALRKASSRT
jgi:aerobic carbon-monoxide dehydrogenase medium subunit